MNRSMTISCISGNKRLQVKRSQPRTERTGGMQSSSFWSCNPNRGLALTTRHNSVARREEKVGHACDESRIAHHIIADSLDWSAAMGGQLVEVLCRRSSRI